MDIRKWFSPKNEGKASSFKKEDKAPKSSKTDSKKGKRKAVIYDSDEEETPPKKPKTPKSTEKKFLKSLKPKKVVEEPKLKPTSVSAFFGSGAIHRKEGGTIAKKKEKVDEKEHHSDEDFEKTLMQLDEENKPKKASKKPNSLSEDKGDDFEKTLKQLDEEDNYKKAKKQRKSSTNWEEDDDAFEKTLKQLDEEDQRRARKSQTDSTEKSSPSKDGKNSSKSSDPSDSSSLSQKLSAKMKEKPLVNGKDDKHERLSGGKDQEGRSKSKHKESPSKRRRESPDRHVHKKEESRGKDKPIKETPSKEKSKKESDSHKRKSEMKETPVKSKSKETPSKERHEETKTPRSNKKHEDSSTPNRAREESKDSPNTSIVPATPDDPLERRKQHAMHYKKYLQRQGPANPGSKEIPEGAPGCLNGLTFVVTGVLESLQREEVDELIKKYGGKVTTSISKKTSYVVLGDDAGPKKLEKMQQLGTKKLNEDELLDLIRTKPGVGGARAPSSEGKKKPQEFTKIKPRPSSHEKDDKDKPSSSQKKLEKERTPQKQEEKKTNKRALEKEYPDVHSAAKKIKSEMEEKASVVSDAAPSQGTGSLLWVDKYAPKSTKQIIGQQGDQSNMRKLMRWLEKWHANRNPAKKHVRPSPWAKADDGSFFKAALLSGPPGVGKTTTAHLVSKECGFDAVEMNASDTRSQKMMSTAFSDMLANTSLFNYATEKGGESVTSKHVLIMDEVDGMAGNEDRGGVAEIINLIKKSKIPIICMCNDRNSTKIRSLANHCFDLRFQKPRADQIRGAMMSICFKEGLKLKPDAITELINGSNQDIRQVLHHLSVWSARDKTLSPEQAKADAAKAKKDLKFGPWDVCKKVFNASDHKDMNIHDKSNLFFNDYSLAPLFVQENYLSAIPAAAKGSKKATLTLVSKAADSLACGDLIERESRSQQAWSLLPVQALYSSVVPGDLLSGYLGGQIQFPSWFGKNSRQKKCERILQELQMHMRLRISASKREVNEDYIQMIRDRISTPLVRKGAEGVSDAIDALDNYFLLRDDLEGLTELAQWPGKKDPMSSVESKVKAAFTRAYNKEGRMNPYAEAMVAKRKKKVAIVEEGYEEEDEEEEESEDSDVDADGMIKVKKAGAGRGKNKPGPSGSSQNKGKAGGSSGKGKPAAGTSGKGRGRGRK